MAWLRSKFEGELQHVIHRFGPWNYDGNEAVALIHPGELNSGTESLLAIVSAAEQLVSYEYITKHSQNNTTHVYSNRAK